MKLVGGNPNPQMKGLEELPGKVNYFRGKDPKQWHTNIPTYAKVKYEKVYPGIDLIYYGNQRQLEYDFIVAPGADPKAVRLAFEGADKLTIDKQGDLVLKSGGDDVRLHKPRVYQDINGQQRKIEGRYVLVPAKSHSKGQVGFQVAAYDKNKPLVIDPVLEYSTYLGGSGNLDRGNSIAVDSNGNVYVTGHTSSIDDFPTQNPVPGGSACACTGAGDVFITKFDPSGTALVYSTYLGGSDTDEGRGIAVDSNGNAYVTGTTTSNNFPTRFPKQATSGGDFDAFVVKLNAAGDDLVYSTYLGGSRWDSGNGVALDTTGNAYVTGVTQSSETDSPKFPTTPGAFDETINSTGDSSLPFGDAFVTKIDASGAAWTYSTYLGGNRGDEGRGIAIDGNGNAYITGLTRSDNFIPPDVQNAFQPNQGDLLGDAFLTKLNAAGNALIYATYLGGDGLDQGNGIAVDTLGNAYVTGTTGSTNFPTQNPFQGPAPGRWDDAFVSKFDASGTALIYSTYLGGSSSDGDRGLGIGVDAPGNAYVIGETWSDDFPLKNPLQNLRAGRSDVFVTKLSATGTAPLIYSTYLGGHNDDVYQDDRRLGIAVDAAGSAYITGGTSSIDFPLSNAFQDTTQNTAGGFGYDAFVAKISDTTPPPPAFSISPPSLSFNNVTLGMTKDIKFTVTNAGGGTLSGSASTSAPFYIVSGGSIVPSVSFNLTAGASQSVTVRFSPNTVGSFNGTVSFTSNGGNSSKMVSGSSILPALATVLGTCGTCGAAAEPVNTATGNYYYQHTDLALPGRGLPLVFTRTLNVQDAGTGPFGSGWTHSYNLKLTENLDGSVVIKMGDGHEEFYDPTGGGTYQAHDPGVFNTLVKNGDGSFVLTQKNQTRMAFTGAGRLLAISDRNGNSLGFAYNGAGQLSTITDTVGRTVTLSYNADNHLVSITDPLGRTVTYGYDANGRLISDTDPNGGVMHYHYNASGLMDLSTDRRGHTLVANTYDINKRVVSQTNGKGAVTQFAYDTPAVGKTSITDARGGNTIHTHDILRRLVQETDPLGHSVSTVYDANNNRTGVIDKNGKVTAFTYDTQGNALTKTDAQGKVTTLEYNTVNDPTRIVDALGQITAFAYDAKGNLNEVTDALGHKTKVTYDTSGQPASVTDALGGVTLNTFNTQGNLTQVEDALGHKTTLTYDAIGRRTGMTDANAHAASFTYDNNGNLVSVTDPLGHATGFSYDANNNRTGVTDPRGNATAFVYDANDLLSKATDPLGNFVQFAYDAADNRIKITDPRGNITQYAYDAANRPTQVTDALNHSTTLAYDANGNLLTQTNPLGHTSSFAYDELNRLLNATDALGNKGFRSYDALGRLTQAKDAQGRITQYTYDALGRLTKVTDAKSGTVVYDYDALGNRIAVTDPNGHKTGYSYDALNRLTAKTDPLGQAYSYSYDPVGNRISLTDAKGQNLLYSYDGNNRLAAIDYPDATQVSFGYDATGNRTRMIDKLGTSTYVFDALNRLDEYTDAFGKTVGNEYDKAGNRTALIYPDGKRVTYAYDALNRMASVTDWLNGVTDYSYDAASKLAEVLNPNGTKAVYGYDAAERLVNLANAKADTSVLASYALTLDAVGNRSGINRIEPLAPIFTNKTQALTFDNDNRLLTLDAAAVTHDPNGNLTAEPGKSFQYDFEDRLVTATGSQTAQFSYDGVGNRLAATRNGQTTRYTLDVSGALSNVLVENDGAGNPTAYYVHGLGLISRITPSGDARYYHYDTIGSTVALTDAAGNVTDSYAYDPFGQVLNAEGASNNPFQYVGQFGVMQEGNGLNFVRARYYDRGLGRFVNKDPLTGNIGDSQSMNRYAYALSNPVKLVDISGFLSKEVSSTQESSGIELLKPFGKAFLDIFSLYINPTKPIVPFIIIPESFPFPTQDSEKIIAGSRLPSSKAAASQVAAAAMIASNGHPSIWRSTWNFITSFIKAGCDEATKTGGCGAIENTLQLGDTVTQAEPVGKDVMRRARTGRQIGYAGTNEIIRVVSKICKALGENPNASEQYLDCVLGSGP